MPLLQVSVSKVCQRELTGQIRKENLNNKIASQVTVILEKNRFIGDDASHNSNAKIHYLVPKISKQEEARE